MPCQTSFGKRGSQELGSILQSYSPTVPSNQIELTSIVFETVSTTGGFIPLNPPPEKPVNVMVLRVSPFIIGVAEILGLSERTNDAGPLAGSKGTLWPSMNGAAKYLYGAVAISGEKPRETAFQVAASTGDSAKTDRATDAIRVVWMVMGSLFVVWWERAEGCASCAAVA